MVHDTYYVVARLHYVLSFVLFAAGILVAWWAILRLSVPPPKRLARITIAVFLAGATLTLVPALLLSVVVPNSLKHADDIEAIALWFRTANTASAIGSVLASLAILSTIATMIRALLRRLVRGSSR